MQNKMDDNEEFRHLCECYFVARMEPARRNEYCLGVENKRGLEPANKLRSDVADIVSERATVI